MASYTTNKTLTLPNYNDQNWNTPLNLDFSIIDQCLGSTIQPTNVSNIYTLSSTDIQNLRINVTGTLTANGTITIPATYGGFWIVANNTTGAYTLNMKTLTGSNLVQIQQGYYTLVYSDGVNCYDAISQKFNVTGGNVAGNLSVSGTLNILNSSAVSKLSFDPNASTPNLSVTGTITASGNITAFSDERLKKNISNIDNALELVKQLRGVRFEDKDGEKYVGVIAQEVKPVVPEVVIEHDDSGYYSVAYQNLVGVLINAIKELSDKVEELEKRV
jgi:Chaperone of endosialidase